MSSISSVKIPPAPIQSAPIKPQTRAPDGDTAAQEAAESSATKSAEQQSSGAAAKPANAVNLLA